MMRPYRAFCTIALFAGLGACVLRERVAASNQLDVRVDPSQLVDETRVTFANGDLPYSVDAHCVGPDRTSLEVRLDPAPVGAVAVSGTALQITIDAEEDRYVGEAIIITFSDAITSDCPPPFEGYPCPRVFTVTDGTITLGPIAPTSQTGAVVSGTFEFIGRLGPVSGTFVVPGPLDCL